MDHGDETLMTELRPLAYGYMRVPCEVEDHVVRDVERKLRDHAEERGFEFAAIFHEFEPGISERWEELTTELQRSDAHHVIVPSLSHVSLHPILRSIRLERLEEDAKAEVLELSDR
ncbi:MAG: recombinase family protein [Pseudonocardiaceae bacterium]